MSEKGYPLCTGFLYSDPSLLKGAGTVINVWGNYYDFNYSPTPEEADERAIASDWRIVGKDIQDVLGVVSNEKEMVQEAA